MVWDWKPRNWMIALISFVSILPYQAMPKTWRSTSIGYIHRRGESWVGILMYFSFCVNCVDTCVYIYIANIWFTTYFVALSGHTHIHMLAASKITYVVWMDRTVFERIMLWGRNPHHGLSVGFLKPKCWDSYIKKAFFVSNRQHR